jgi:hypothetical protein
MAGMNVKRLLVAGAVAGVVMNVIDFAANYITGASLYRDLMAVNPALWENINRSAIQPVYYFIDFILAFVIVWFYVAIRPRYGAGPATALRAAAAIWLFGAAQWYLFVLMGLLSHPTFGIGSLVSAVNFAATALVGGKLYRENETA